MKHYPHITNAPAINKIRVDQQKVGIKFQDFLDDAVKNQLSKIDFKVLIPHQTYTPHSNVAVLVECLS